MEEYESDEVRAAAGSLLLDEKMPGWALLFTEENIEDLDIMDGDLCICGVLADKAGIESMYGYQEILDQLGIRTADETMIHGFLSNESETGINNAWRNEIRSRQ